MWRGQQAPPESDWRPSRLHHSQNGFDYLASHRNQIGLQFKLHRAAEAERRVENSWSASAPVIDSGTKTPNVDEKTGNGIRHLEDDDRFFRGLLVLSSWDNRCEKDSKTDLIVGGTRKHLSVVGLNTKLGPWRQFR